MRRLLQVSALFSLATLYYLHLPSRSHAQESNYSFFSTQSEAQKCLDILHDGQAKQTDKPETMHGLKSHCEPLLSRQKLLESKLSQPIISSIVIDWHPTVYARKSPLDGWITKYDALSAVIPLFRSCQRKDSDYQFLQDFFKSVEQYSGVKVFPTALVDSCRNLTSVIRSLPKYYLIQSLESEALSDSPITASTESNCKKWYSSSDTPFLIGADGRDGIIVLQEIVTDGGYVPLGVSKLQSALKDELEGFAEIGQILPSQRVSLLIKSYNDGGTKFCRLALAKLKQTNYAALKKGLRPAGKRTPIQMQ